MTLLTYLSIALIVASTDVMLSHLKKIKYVPLPSVLLALAWPITCTVVLLIGVFDIPVEKD